MSVHEEIMSSMKGMAETFAGLGVKLILPPKSNEALRTEYTAVDMGKMLEAKIPFDHRYTNPLKMYQGGILAGAFDEVFGPLTYMTAGAPVVTLEMSVTFLRPFTERDGYVSIRAEVVSKTKSVIVMRAEARNPEGKLVATAQNHSIIVSEQKLKGAP